MTKSGIDKMLDNIKNRDNDDPTGLKSKKKEITDKNPTQKMGSGFDGIIDNIKNRDANDPTGTKKKKSEDKNESKKKSISGFDSIIDSINDRDADDPTGTKTKKKDIKEKETERSTDIGKATTEIVSAGIVGVTGLGASKYMNTIMKKE